MGSEILNNKNMCLYPRLIPNPKYKKNNKNQGIIPVQKDSRVGLVPIGCGNCMECRKKKANEWKIRLNEEIKNYKHGEMHFVTMTFNEEELTKLEAEIDKDFRGYERDNQVATLAIERFRMRWKKTNGGRSVRHWLITELGGTATERIHLHGILFTNRSQQEVEKIWKYGQLTYGDGYGTDYVNEATIGYIVKYVTKVDTIHKEYKAKILTSPGIGATYINERTKKSETYKNRAGYKMQMPMYYRNKMYTDDEKENLWIEKLDKNVRYVNGIKIERVNTDEGQRHYEGAREAARKRNIRLGYGKLEDWDAKQYEEALRNLKALKRRQKKWKKEQNIT